MHVWRSPLDSISQDFVSTSAGAGDSGRVAKRNGSGKLDKTFPSRFGVRAIQNAT
jgi:hypothetical protein